MFHQFSTDFTKRLTTLVVLLLLPSIAIFAQRAGASKATEGANMSLGISSASTGPGINLAYKFNKSLTVRTGIDGFDAQVALNTEIENEPYNVDVGMKITSLFAIADLYYLGPLFISAGAGYNMFQLNADATHADGANIGGLAFQLRSPQKITPYVGFGLGRKVAKNRRVAFSADAGFFYLGKQEYTINATGLLASELLPGGGIMDHPNVEEIRNTLDMFTFYPVLKLGVSYKFLR